MDGLVDQRDRNFAEPDTNEGQVGHNALPSTLYKYHHPPMSLHGRISECMHSKENKTKLDQNKD